MNGWDIGKWLKRVGIQIKKSKLRLKILKKEKPG